MQPCFMVMLTGCIGSQLIESSFKDKTADIRGKSSIHSIPSHNIFNPTSWGKGYTNNLLTGQLLNLVNTSQSQNCWHLAEMHQLVRDACSKTWEGTRRVKSKYQSDKSELNIYHKMRYTRNEDLWVCVHALVTQGTMLSNHNKKMERFQQAF